MTAENLFSAVLTFSLMAGGTVAFGADLLRTEPAPAAAATATLPPVTITSHRIAGADRVTLPTVTVIGHPIAAIDRTTLPTVTVIGRRVAPTEVAAETGSVEQRVQ